MPSTPAAGATVATIGAALAEEERASFVALYFEEPNDAGHAHGPDAPETIVATERADALLGFEPAPNDGVWERIARAATAATESVSARDTAHPAEEAP